MCYLQETSLIKIYIDEELRLEKDASQKIIFFRQWYVSRSIRCHFVCLYVCVIMKCRWMCVGIYVEVRQEFTLMSPSSGLIQLGILETKTLSLIVIIHLGIPETKTLTVTWGSLIQLGWLFLEPQGSTCLNQLSTWITVLSPLARLFNVYVREQTQVPLLTRQALHLLK